MKSEMFLQRHRLAGRKRDGELLRSDETRLPRIYIDRDPFPTTLLHQVGALTRVTSIGQTNAGKRGQKKFKCGLIVGFGGSAAAMYLAMLKFHSTRKEIAKEEWDRLSPVRVVATGAMTTCQGTIADCSKKRMSERERERKRERGIYIETNALLSGQV